MAWRVLNKSRHQVYQPAPLDSGGMRGCPPQEKEKQHPRPGKSLEMKSFSRKI
jgi:hypothetical protein